MRILFVVRDLFIGEPIGVLQLSAILKEHGHETRLVATSKHDVARHLKDFTPDIVAYSAMSADITELKHADATVRDWIDSSGRRVLRVMGGPHPTYFHEVLDEMMLDAICIGEGDHAIVRLIEAFSDQRDISGIPNIMVPGQSLDQVTPELVSDIDALPYPDRSIFYEAAPSFRFLALRGVLTMRGCPYNCTYCYNHLFNKRFGGLGSILRRRQVDDVIDEIKYLVTEWPPVKLIKFIDDTFAHKLDDWLINFMQRYRSEIGLPFNCMMRSNAMSDEMAQLLKSGGCVSITMAVEHGNERVRNEVLKRGLSDKVVINSFECARRHGIKLYGNTLLAIPGTGFTDDIASFRFAKKLNMTVSTFGVFCPYPRTELANYAIEQGVLEPDYNYELRFGNPSPMNNYSPKEKRMQLGLVYLGPLFAALPDRLIPLLLYLVKLPFLSFYRFVGTAYLVMATGLRIFPGIYPISPIRLFHLFSECLSFFIPPMSPAVAEPKHKS